MTNQMLNDRALARAKALVNFLELHDELTGREAAIVEQGVEEIFRQVDRRRSERRAV